MRSPVSTLTSRLTNSTGAPSRSERVAKYNRLMQIEQQSGLAYPGMDAFTNLRNS